MILRGAQRLSQISTRYNRLPAQKIVEKAIDKMILTPSTAWLKRKMADNPKYEDRIRWASHQWVKVTHRFHLWKAKTDDGVEFTPEEKKRLLDRKLKKADKNVENLLATFLDLTKQIIYMACSFALLFIIAYFYDSDESEAEFVNRRVDELQAQYDEVSEELKKTIEQAKSNQTTVETILLENERLKTQCLQISTDLTLAKM